MKSYKHIKSTLFLSARYNINLIKNRCKGTNVCDFIEFMKEFDYKDKEFAWVIIPKFRIGSFRLA